MRGGGCSRGGYSRTVTVVNVSPVVYLPSTCRAVGCSLSVLLSVLERVRVLPRPSTYSTESLIYPDLHAARSDNFIARFQASSRRGTSRARAVSGFIRTRKTRFAKLSEIQSRIERLQNFPGGETHELCLGVSIPGFIHNTVNSAPL